MYLTQLMAVFSRLGKWLSVHRWRLFFLFVGVLLPLAAFAALAEDVREGEPFAWDGAILLYVHGFATTGRDAVMLFFTRIGYLYGVVPIDIVILLAFIIWKRWGDLLFFGLAVGGSAVLNLVVKRMFGRERPALWPSLAPETTFSFPSGHAMGSMALVAALVVLAWPTHWRWPTVILGSLFVLLVSLSRIYLGVHYPSDILAGWAASLAWVMGVSSVLYKRATKPTPEATPTLHT